ncbi:Thymidylate synthase [Friedmanniomyces endolithicus]|uniref:thymidylate synthase n=1 Tax=Friedmanniomyces endolithicus TaxID=329885 RepID=A0AAN6QM02_9PEZI|nr:Thymidylate synthase [Friedmanniomyces endolithicus]KAK0783120.1 Thymidylate synthase [Friedmanniomyces endolithicus]KAK0788958.1 Thymidylate synthase [Friedmanniomyces endolithicus]KAK0795297.1 Thymidylate synthase [Friedmanniomyces endolithicus]KAK0838999.1 Thymidylate synthase [Friedmanniomyces endolithicus]
MSPSAVNTDATVDLPDTQPKTEQAHEEQQYLSLIRLLLTTGEHRPDRTGTGTKSLPFPPQHKYTLSRPDGSLLLPLLTTKRVFLRAVIAELLWFITGDTNAATLQNQNVRIWDGNASRQYLDSVGLTHREEGDLGPVYGFQWRHFGAPYTDCHADYSGQGVDQLAEVLRKLRHTPYDRRIILSAWNPADLPHMALPPCHMFAQFYVAFPPTSPTRDSDGSKKGTLHTLLYQRSCDMGLGVPFNIASYALLTHMLARCANLIPGTLTHTMGDAHVYLDHEEALRVQVEREPREFPTLEIGSGREAGCEIDGWRVEDFVVKGYEPWKGLAMKMSRISNCSVPANYPAALEHGNDARQDPVSTAQIEKSRSTVRLTHDPSKHDPVIPTRSRKT